MSHQPYENWILDQGALSTEERRALLEHLTACNQCQRLDNYWQAVYQELRAHPMASPAAGFTWRWQSGLAGRRSRELRKQAWRIFGILMAAALFFLLVLAGYVISTTSTRDWLVAFSGAAGSSRVFLQMAIYVVQNWFASIPFAVNIALWIYLIVMLSILTMFWLLVIWRTKTVGVFNQ